ncbi:MAG TPA: ArgE/DapE family deacylase [Chloroflexota bacterium]|nr:ArgE/DapE family deacylase [Chloroflexota bacterium]
MAVEQDAGLHPVHDTAVCARVRASLAAIQAEMIAFLQGLVRIPTENPPGRAYPECAAFAGTWLERLGYEVRYVAVPDDQLAVLAPHGQGLPRVNVLARLSGVDERPVLHFNGHIDVVPAGDGWSVDPFGGTIREGRIFGRGVSDMKGGIAAQVYAVEALRRAGFRLRGTVEHSLVTDEESTGNRNAGTGYLVEQGYIGPGRIDYVIITEPLEVDNICLGHRGTIQGAIETLGRQAHGAMPERGVNAIEKMALALAAIERDLKPLLRERRSSLCIIPDSASGSSVTAGTIAGGTSTNTVAAHCRVTFDRRLVENETIAGARAEMLAIFDRLAAEDPDFLYRYHESYATDPVWVGTETRAGAAFAEAIRAVLGREPRLVCSPGTDDQRFVVRAGINECIVYGPGEIRQTHVVDESLALDDLRVSAEVMALAALDLLGYGQET